ncbi:MAG: NUDIX domain-containing protein [Candidatus Anstonellales archaeon]
MRKEKSAGFVVYNPNNKKFLILHYEEGHWDFPKGHIEKDESPEQAALRELEEETGIKKVNVIDGFKQKIKYYFKARYMDNETIYKEVLFFYALLMRKMLNYLMSI